MTETEMRILKTATCKSVSGKSTLTYRLGADADDALHIHILKNSGAGQFSAEWIRLDDVLAALAEGHEGSPLTSYLLEPLFRGKSVNTPAFIMAALTHEGLLRVLKGKKRGHELVDPEGHLTRLRKLATGGSPGGTRKKTARKTQVRKPAAKKARIKKKAAARKKQRKVS